MISFSGTPSLSWALNKWSCQTATTKTYLFLKNNSAWEELEQFDFMTFILRKLCRGTRGGGPGYFYFLSSFIMLCMQPKTNTDRGNSFVPNVRWAQAWTGTQQHDLAHAFPSVTETELWSQFYFCLQGWNQRKQSCELNILIFYTRLQELNVYKSTK